MEDPLAFLRWTVRMYIISIYYDYMSYLVNTLLIYRVSMFLENISMSARVSYGISVR
jgi:hypothetical protein